MFRQGRQVALLLSLLLLLVAALPAGAAEKAVGSAVDALVYYGNGLTEQSLIERHGITPAIGYENFALARLTPAQRESLEQSGAGIQVLPDKYRIELGAGFDTRFGDGVPAALRLIPPAGKGAYLVQFAGPIKPEWLDELAARGAEVYGYVPNFAVLVRITATERKQIQSLPYVQWTGFYHPGYKLAAKLAGGEAYVEFFPWAKELPQPLQAAGLSVKSIQNGRAHVSGSRRALEQLARLDDVAWIGPSAVPQLFNAATRGVIKSNVPHSKSVTGGGEIVAVSDTGVYKAHEAFAESGKVVAVIDVAGDGGASGGDGHGHGSHVAGSVLGDASAFGLANKQDGQGFGARLVDVKIFNNSGSWAGGSDYYSFWIGGCICKKA